MGNKNKPKMVTIQVIKPFNEGRTLSIGDRIDVHPRRARIMEQAGYAIRVDPEAPYTHPAKNPEHQFKEVSFDEPEDVIPDKAEVEVKKGDEVIKKGNVIHGKDRDYEIGEKIGGSTHKAKAVEKPKPVKVKIPSLDDLTFTNKAHVKALTKSGIHVLNDVEGWDINALAMINGVSSKTAKKLMDAYNHHCNIDHNKDSDMEIKTK